MRRSLYILFIIPFLFAAGTGCGSKSNKINDQGGDKPGTGNKSVLLDIDKFEAGFTADPNAQVIDVRTPEEFNRGHLKGAININYQGSEFTAEIAKLDKKKPTYVYCQSGGRSAEACNYMSNQDFANIFDMDGGYSAWSHYKKPIEIPEGK
jgi:rhodanese-related sulfurtransferase